MLNTKQKLYAAIVAAALLVALMISWASTHSSSYEVCRDERYSSSGNIPPDFSEKIAYFFVCEGVAIDANGDFITAVATFFMAIFTATLWFVTSKSVELARQEFTSTHRPRIILREAIIGSVLEGEPIKVIMHFANVGDTKGIILRSVVDLRIIPGALEIPLFNSSVEPHNELGQIELGPGAAILVPWSKLQKRDRSQLPPRWEQKKYIEIWDDRIGVRSREARIHLVGEFIYADEAIPPIPRRTRFCRVLIPERQRFYRIENEPDLDYAD